MFAPVSLIAVGGKDVLLIERFDRVKANRGWQRNANGVRPDYARPSDEMMARYASYEDLAETIRHRFTDPKDTPERTLRPDMFQHPIVAITDDHARKPCRLLGRHDAHAHAGL